MRGVAAVDSTAAVFNCKFLVTTHKAFGKPCPAQTQRSHRVQQTRILLKGRRDACDKLTSCLIVCRVQRRANRASLSDTARHESVRYILLSRQASSFWLHTSRYAMKCRAHPMCGQSNHASQGGNGSSGGWGVAASLKNSIRCPPRIARLPWWARSRCRHGCRRGGLRF